MPDFSTRDVAVRLKTGRSLLLIMLFVAVCIAGLSYVKWWPYYHKALTAVAERSIGTSILTGVNGESAFVSWSSAWHFFVTYFQAIWKAAVLGIVIGSLVQVLLPAEWLQKWLGKAGFKSTFWGGVASLPGMMCTCCAAPIASGLRKRNVSVGAALAFWLGNPVLNPATLVFMTFVLSWEFTVIRLVFGLLLVFGISYLANRFVKSAEWPEEMAERQPDLRSPEGGFGLRWLRAMGRMTLQIVPAYFLTVLLLGALQSWMFPVWLSVGIVAIVLFAVTGTLFVIPTAAEIPIIQGLMALGLGAGPASALLMTLPAVSLPSLLMLTRSFPRKVLLFVLGSVIGIGILSGLAGALWL